MRRAACIAGAACALLGVQAAAGAAAPTQAQLAGQRITWPIDGTSVSPAMRAAIRRGEVGSVILFARNAPTRAALRRLTSLSPRPALLEPRIVGGLLRGSLGFTGVTITDAIDTPALRPWGGTRRASGSAAAAGMDLVIVATSEAEAARGMRGVRDALAARRISPADARASLDRVLALRRQLAP